MLVFRLGGAVLLPSLCLFYLIFFLNCCHPSTLNLTCTSHINYFANIADLTLRTFLLTKCIPFFYRKQRCRETEYDLEQTTFSLRHCWDRTHHEILAALESAVKLLLSPAESAPVSQFTVLSYLAISWKKHCIYEKPDCLVNSFSCLLILQNWRMRACLHSNYPSAQ